MDSANSRRIFRGAKSFLSQLWVATLCFAIGFQPFFASLAHAQSIIVDPNGNVAFQPAVRIKQNTPVVDITKPNSGGVSINKFSRYNVDDNGVVLNNSTRGKWSHLAGYVSSNPNLTSGTATTIVNEVTSQEASTLTGLTEVLGSTADVIIANPNGVTCDGCKFRQVDTLTLTTGVPTVDGSSITLDVQQGTVTIGQHGLRDYYYTPNNANLIGRVVVLDGKVDVDDDITIVGGAQRYDLNNGTVVQNLTGVGSAGSYVVDASNYGALSADRINIIGTEAGLGVRMQSSVKANRYGVTVVADGNVELSSVDADGTVAISSTSGSVNIEHDVASDYNSVTITSAADITLGANGGVYGATGVVLDAFNGAVTIDGEVQSSRDFELYGETLDVDGSLYAKYNLQFDASDSIQIVDSDLIASYGTLTGSADGDFSIQSSYVYAGDGISLASTSGALTLTGQAKTYGTFVLDAETVALSGNLYARENVAITAANGIAIANAALDSGKHISIDTAAGNLVVTGNSNIDAYYGLDLSADAGTVALNSKFEARNDLTVSAYNVELSGELQSNDVVRVTASNAISGANIEIDGSDGVVIQAASDILLASADVYGDDLFSITSDSGAIGLSGRFTSNDTDLVINAATSLAASGVFEANRSYYSDHIISLNAGADVSIADADMRADRIEANSASGIFAIASSKLQADHTIVVNTDSFELGSGVEFSAPGNPDVVITATGDFRNGSVLTDHDATEINFAGNFVNLESGIVEAADLSITSGTTGKFYNGSYVVGADQDIINAGLLTGSVVSDDSDQNNHDDYSIWNLFGLLGGGGSGSDNEEQGPLTLTLEANNIVNTATGRIETFDDIDIQAAGDVLNDGSIVTDETLDIVAAGMVFSDGTIEGPTQTISANEVGFGAASIITSTDLIDIDATTTIANVGIINGDKLELDAPAILNSGEVVTRTLTSVSGTVDNSGTVSATETVDIVANSEFLNTGELLSDDLLRMSGQTFNNDFGLVLANRWESTNSTILNSGEIAVTSGIELVGNLDLLDNDGFMTTEGNIELRGLPGATFYFGDRSYLASGITPFGSSTSTDTEIDIEVDTLVAAGTIEAEERLGIVADSAVISGPMSADALIDIDTGDLTLADGAVLIATEEIDIDTTSLLAEQFSTMDGSTINLDAATADLGGIVQASTLLNVDVDATLTNTGRTEGGTIAIEASSFANLEAGSIKAVDALTIATTDITNSAVLGSLGTMDIAADTFENNAYIAVDTVLTIDADSIANANLATITTGADMLLDAETILQNDGQIVSYGDATLTSANEVRNNGVVIIDDAMTIASPVFENTETGFVRVYEFDDQVPVIANAGKFFSNLDLDLTGLDLITNDGTIASAADVVIDADTMIMNPGSVVMAGLTFDDPEQDLTANSVSISATNLDASGVISAGAAVSLSTPNSLPIGIIRSGTTTSVSAADIDILVDGAIEATGALTLDAIGGVVNEGLLKTGAELILADGFGDFINNNAVSVDTMDARVNGQFVNVGLWESNGDVAVSAETIENQVHMQSRGDLALTSDTTVTLDGTTTVLGNLSLAGTDIATISDSGITSDTLTVAGETLILDGNVNLASETDANVWTLSEKVQVGGMVFANSELSLATPMLVLTDGAMLSTITDFAFDGQMADVSGTIISDNFDFTGDVLTGEVSGRIFSAGVANIAAVESIDFDGEIAGRAQTTIVSKSVDLSGNLFGETLDITATEGDINLGANAYAYTDFSATAADTIRHSDAIEGGASVLLTARAYAGEAGSSVRSTETDLVLSEQALIAGDVLAADDLRIDAPLIEIAAEGRTDAVSTTFVSDTLLNRGTINGFGIAVETGTLDQYGTIDVATYVGLMANDLNLYSGSSIATEGHVYANVANDFVAESGATVDANVIDIRSATFDNAGDLTANEVVNIADVTGALTNTGSISATTIAMLTAGSLALAGEIGSAATTDVNLSASDATITGTLTADNVRLLADNSATLSDTAAITGTELVALVAEDGGLSSSAAINGGDIVLETTGALQNVGQITGTGTVALTGDTIQNGQAPGTLALAAAAAGDIAGQTVVMNATNTLTSTGYISATQAAGLKSEMGDVTLAGTVQSDGSIDILAREGVLDATNATLAGAQLTMLAEQFAGATTLDVNDPDSTFYLEAEVGDLEIAGNVNAKDIGIIAQSGNATLSGNFTSLTDIYAFAGQTLTLGSNTQLTAAELLHLEGTTINNLGAQANPGEQFQFVSANSSFKLSDFQIAGAMNHGIAVEAPDVTLDNDVRFVGSEAYFASTVGDINATNVVVSADKLTLNSARDINVAFDPVVWNTTTSSVATGDWLNIGDAGRAGRNLVAGDGGLTLFAGRDIKLTSGKAHTSGDLAVFANGNILSEAIYKDYTRANPLPAYGWDIDPRFGNSGSYVPAGVSPPNPNSLITAVPNLVKERRAFPNELSAGGNIEILAGGVGTFVGSSIAAQSGDLTILAESGLNFAAASGYREYQRGTSSSSGFIIITTTVTETYQFDDIYTRPFVSSGGNMSIGANADVVFGGLELDAGGDVEIYSDNQSVTLGTYAERWSREYFYDRDRGLGLFPGFLCCLNIFGGSSTTFAATATTNTGSNFTTDGQLTLDASDDLTIIGGEFDIGGDFNVIAGGNLLILGAINTEKVDRFSERDNLITVTTIQDNFDRESVALPEINVAGETNFEVDGDITITGYRGATVNDVLLEAIEGEDFKQVIRSIFDEGEASAADDQADDVSDEYTRTYDLPTAEIGSQFAYLDQLIIEEGATYDVIELRDYSYYDKQVQMSPAAMALLTTVATVLTSGAAAGLGVSNAMFAAGIDAALANAAANLVAGAATGDVDLGLILEGAVLAGFTTAITTGLTNAVDLGEGTIDFSRTDNYAVNRPPFSVSAIADRAGDRVISTAVGNVLNGEDVFEGFEDLGASLLISESMALAQFGIGELGNGSSADWEGTPGHAILHGGLGCIAADLLGGDCAAGFASGVGQSLYAGSLSDTDLSDAEQRRQASLIGAAIGFVFSEGNALNVTAGSQIVQSGITFNRQLHRSEAEWLRENAAAFAEEQCDAGNCISEEEALRQLTLQAGRNVDSQLGAGVAYNEDAQAFLNSQAPIGVIPGTGGNPDFADANQTWFTADVGVFDNQLVNYVFLTGAADLYEAFPSYQASQGGEVDVFLTTLMASSQDDLFDLSPQAAIGVIREYDLAFESQITALPEELQEPYILGVGNLGEASVRTLVLQMTEAEFNSLTPSEQAYLESRVIDSYFYTFGSLPGGDGTSIRPNLAQVKSPTLRNRLVQGLDAQNVGGQPRAITQRSDGTYFYTNDRGQQVDITDPFTQRYLTTSGGRWGNSETRALNYETTLRLRENGVTVRQGGGIGREEYIRPACSNTGCTYPDISGTYRGQQVFVQTVTTGANGSPIQSELDAIARLQVQRPGSIIISIPKGASSAQIDAAITNALP